MVSKIKKITIKLCNKCKSIKKLSEFSIDKSKKDKLCLTCKDCHKKYRELHKKQIEKYRKTHKKEAKEYMKKYQKEHKKEKKEYQKKYKKYRLKTNIGFRITEYLRIRMHTALKRNAKKGYTLDLLGCSIDQLKNHLKNQFKPGMTWSNYGKWHIDHIRPCASFDLSKLSEQRKCFHYTNLQPLWAEENREKGIKWQ